MCDNCLNKCKMAKKPKPKVEEIQTLDGETNPPKPPKNP